MYVGPGPGHPDFVPTHDQRQLVQMASAIGLTQLAIAEELGIDGKTLRKHFRRELDGGKFKADMKVGQNMFALTSDPDPRTITVVCAHQ
jgi:hypothetical protein